MSVTLNSLFVSILQLLTRTIAWLFEVRFRKPRSSDPPIDRELELPEHDACGLIAVQVDGKVPTRRTVDLVIEGLLLQDHRAGSLTREDGEHGDGAGVMFRLPEAFFLNAVGNPEGITGDRLVVGQILFRPSGDLAAMKKVVEKVASEQGITMIGWRKVPADVTALPGSLRKNYPETWQYIGATTMHIPHVANEPLYFRLQRRVTRAFSALGMKRKDAYVASFGRLIVYKGQFTPRQLVQFYACDLMHENFKSTAGIGHDRYATFAAPNPDRAQPFNFFAINGEATNMRAARDWMEMMWRMRGMTEEDFFDSVPGDGGDSMAIDASASALAVVLNLPIHLVVELLLQRAWEHNTSLSQDQRELFERAAIWIRPWEGPQAVEFLDEHSLGVKRDRKGLRPVATLELKGRIFILSSEPFKPSGVTDSDILRWSGPGGGECWYVTRDGVIHDDAMARTSWESLSWREALPLDAQTNWTFPKPTATPPLAADALALNLQNAWRRAARFGYGSNHVKLSLFQDSQTGEPAVYSMGRDRPPAELLSATIPFTTHFLAEFCQIVAPPGDSFLETWWNSYRAYIRLFGRGLFGGQGSTNRSLVFESPIIPPGGLEPLVAEFESKALVLRGAYRKDAGPEGLLARLQQLQTEAERAVEAGTELLVLDSIDAGPEELGIPSCFFVGAIHQHLVAKGLRLATGLVARTEALDGFGLGICIDAGVDLLEPTLAYAFLEHDDLSAVIGGHKSLDDYSTRVKKWIKAGMKWLAADMGRNCISTLDAMRAGTYAAHFSDEVNTMCFPTWLCPHGGMTFADIGERLLRYDAEVATVTKMGDGGLFRNPSAPAATATYAKRIKLPTAADASALPPVSGEDAPEDVPQGWNSQTRAALWLAIGVKDGENWTFKTGWEHYQRYMALVRDGSHPMGLHHLWKPKKKRAPVPLDQVESVEQILLRMRGFNASVGALGAGPHEIYVAGMRRLDARVRKVLNIGPDDWRGVICGGGEGGIDPYRYFQNALQRTPVLDLIGHGKYMADWLIPTEDLERYVAGKIPAERYSRLHTASVAATARGNTQWDLTSADFTGPNEDQVASGRFGKTPWSMRFARVMSRKFSQGAKPGEGGSLGGKKASWIIAWLRRIILGQRLQSPANQHDEYSVEDVKLALHLVSKLAKNARRSAKISLQQAERTIAAVLGLMKAGYQEVLLSTGRGGTGNAKLNSIHQVGFDLQIVGQVHDALIELGLRERIMLITDGGLIGPDDAISAFRMGADAVAFGQLLMIALSCVKKDECHIGECPAGLTRGDDSGIRKFFRGSPLHVERIVLLTAMGIRARLAEEGYRSVEELIGRSDELEVVRRKDCPTADGLDTTVYFTKFGEDCTAPRSHKTDNTMPGGYSSHGSDTVLDAIQPILEGDLSPIEVKAGVTPKDAGFFASISEELAKRYRDDGLPRDTLNVFTSHPDESAGATGGGHGTGLLPGVTLTHFGRVGSVAAEFVVGGRLIVKLPQHLDPWFNHAIGESCFYGATRGFDVTQFDGCDVSIGGRAGDRIGIRLSAGRIRIMGSGDNQANMMTGGRLVIAGPCGWNAGAGMTGGEVFVHDPDGTFVTQRRFNSEWVEAKRLDEADEAVLRAELDIFYTDAPTERLHGIREGFNAADWVKLVSIAVNEVPEPPLYDYLAGRGEVDLTVEPVW